MGRYRYRKIRAEDLQPGDEIKSEAGTWLTPVRLGGVRFRPLGSHERYYVDVWTTSLPGAYSANHEFLHFQSLSIRRPTAYRAGLGA